MLKNDAWLAKTKEDAIDPLLEIIDPHHHLWEQGNWIYTLKNLWEDTSSGHNITQTIFMECGSNYYKEGAEHLRSIGETEFAAKCAKTSAQTNGKAKIAGIVSFADLTSPHLDEILHLHKEKGEGLFRGIRHAGAYDDEKETLSILPPSPKNLFYDEKFRDGVQHLGKLGLTYDSWHYHHQNKDFIELAKAVPQTKIILDHFGTPLGVGRFKGKKEEIFENWKMDMVELAKYPNVYAKLGGLAMRDNGFYFHKQEKPPTSDEFVAAQGHYYHFMIKHFGAKRCMFESNFPVDRLSISYCVFWNAMKKIAADYSEPERIQLFSDTARMVYKI